MKRLLIAATACALTPTAAPAAALAASPAPAPEAAAAIEPARLEAARLTVDYIFPTGTYARLMEKTMGQMMDQMFDSVGKLPLRELAAIGKVSPDQLKTLGDATLSEIMTIYDPHYQQRTQLTMRAMTTEMTGLMTQFEPAMRDGLARAYARRFTAAQLAELNRFFATPTGTAYAADSMAIFMDPEVVAKMAELMPAIMKQMPALTKKMEAAAATLPPPRRLEEMSATERKRLAGLLGMKESELGQ